MAADYFAVPRDEAKFDHFLLITDTVSQFAWTFPRREFRTVPLRCATSRLFFSDGICCHVSLRATEGRARAGFTGELIAYLN